MFSYKLNKPNKLMRAKFINEIKRNQEGSGLGVIGIGRAHMLKGINYIKKSWPDAMEQLMDIRNKNASNIPIFIELIPTWDNFQGNSENLLIFDAKSKVRYGLLRRWLEDITSNVSPIIRLVGSENFPEYVAEIYYSKEYSISRIDIAKSEWMLNVVKTDPRYKDQYLYQYYVIPI